MRSFLVLLVLTASAAASPVELVQDTGTIARAADGIWIGTTQPAETTFSFGRFQVAGPHQVPFTVAATMQRLDPDAISIELHVLGGAVLVRDGGIALWVDDASFARDGWRPLPGFRGQLPHRYEVTRTAEAITARIDGTEVARWTARATAPAGTIALALKGTPRRRARLRITALEIH